MKKMSFAVSGVLVSVLSIQAASASCIPAYEEKIRELTGRMGVARYSVITGAGGAAVATSAILAAGGTLAIGSAVGAPAVALVAGGYLAETAIVRAEYREARRMIRAAREREVNPDLEKLFESLEKKGISHDRIQVMDWIREADDSGAFCPMNPRTEKRKLAFPAKIRKMLIGELVEG